jgi:hypothetical protein
VAWAPDYVSATDIATYLGVGDTVDNAMFGLWATAASRAVDRKCNRQFGKVASVVPRTYRRTPFYDRTTGMWLLDIDDLADTTGLLVNGVAYASSGATLLPDNAAADGRPYTRLGLVSWPYNSYPGMPQSTVVTGLWGWASVPSQVIAACYLQAARWNFRRSAPAGVAGSPDQGSEVRLTARLDPDVATTLIGLSRPRAVG